MITKWNSQSARFPRQVQLLRNPMTTQSLNVTNALNPRKLKEIPSCGLPTLGSPVSGCKIVCLLWEVPVLQSISQLSRKSPRWLKTSPKRLWLTVRTSCYRLSYKWCQSTHKSKRSSPRPSSSSQKHQARRNNFSSSASNVGSKLKTSHSRRTHTTARNTLAIDLEQQQQKLCPSQLSCKNSSFS